MPPIPRKKSDVQTFRSLSKLPLFKRLSNNGEISKNGIHEGTVIGEESLILKKKKTIKRRKLSKNSFEEKVEAADLSVEKLKYLVLQQLSRNKTKNQNKL